MHSHSIHFESFYYVLGFVPEAEKAKMNKIWSFPSGCSDTPCWTSTGGKMSALRNRHARLCSTWQGNVTNAQRNFPCPGKPGLDPPSSGSAKSEAWSIPTSETQREKAQGQGELVPHLGTARTANSPRRGQDQNHSSGTDPC